MTAEGATRVLIAEDDPLASMALRAQLEALDYDVLAAARDGEEALLLGRCLPVDIAIFDLRMPGRDGLDAAVRLFDDAPTPVVLLSGFGTADLPHPLPRPPIFATLTKPVGLDDVKRAVGDAETAFRSWLDGDPEREQRVERSRRERDSILTALRATAGERTLSRAARDLARQAEESGRSLADTARDLAGTNGAGHA